ncbi:MAG: TIGR02452 family protein [Clostridiales bacterium]|nr:TIGR02452 family protein [Clostridiales bacterium]
MRIDNIQMLKDTLDICEQGYYVLNGKKNKLKLSLTEMKEVRVFLPDEIAALAQYKEFQHIHVIGRCGFGCENMDSFSLARKRYHDCSYMFTGKNSKEILVLNLANPVNPGGGVRRGTRAQEEDLCRKSSLLLSLEGSAASRYYSYNRSLHTYMGSDAIVITPKVEIIKDENGNLLEDSVIVAVMTYAAPCLTGGMAGLSQAQYEKIVYNRILGMLRCAAYMGYKNLVLGAFGCGAFGNDAKVVSDLFYKALKEFDFDGMREKDMFRRIDFAVLSRGSESYNFQEFYRNFGDGNYYHAEDEAERQRSLESIKATEVNLDKICGSLVGGAIGDALGYPVEFLRKSEIVEKYGESGITCYELDQRTGKALISDDTQMTLFTANGILVGETRLCMRGVGGVPHMYVQRSYQDWLTTQEVDYHTGKNTKRYNQNGGISWLLDVPELYSRRAPGNTCLSALCEAKTGTHGGEDFIDNPRNSSKGCGGLMRVAPLGLHYDSVDVAELDKEGAILSAITHGHPLGYMPSAVLTHILNRIIYPKERNHSLKEIVLEGKETTCELFSKTEHLDEMCAIIDKAVSLAENSDPDQINIKRLGEGWVAEEALAIAIYCSLRYEHDFSAGVIAAVNHDGDSDSTGAVVGNILGAINGYNAIEDKWKNDLELNDVLLEMAIDLCHGCHMSEYSNFTDQNWARKYMDMHWKPEPQFVFFWHEYDENGCFSNWYESPFVIDDFCYSYVEQYLMAQKAKWFHDSKAYTSILKTDSPRKCKRIGKTVTPFDNTVWCSVRYDVLKTGVRAKFTQNEELKRKLLSTGQSIIAEASPYDNIYGIGIAADVASGLSPAEWPGRNLLGHALMEVRAELTESMRMEDIVNSSTLDSINRFLRNG